MDAAWGTGAVAPPTSKGQETENGETYDARNSRFPGRAFQKQTAFMQEVMRVGSFVSHGLGSGLLAVLQICSGWGKRSTGMTVHPRLTGCQEGNPKNKAFSLP